MSSPDDFIHDIMNIELVIITINIICFLLFTCRVSAPTVFFSAGRKKTLSFYVKKPGSQIIEVMQMLVFFELENC
jgi:hypothetical protein